MKESYTAADMASAAAQGFRDGMKRAADICEKIYMDEDPPENNIAFGRQNCILEELKGFQE